MISETDWHRQTLTGSSISLIISDKHYRSPFRRNCNVRKQKRITEKGNDFARLLAQMQNRESPEKMLAAQLAKLGKYVLPVSFETGTPAAKLREEPEWLRKFSAKASSGAALASAKSESIAFAAQNGMGMAEGAAGAGHDGIFPEKDGKVRFDAENKTLILEDANILGPIVVAPALPEAWCSAWGWRSWSSAAPSSLPGTRSW